MSNNEITIYSEKGRKIYSFNRIDLLKLEKQYPIKTECKGGGGFVHNERQKKIQGLIGILLKNESAEINLSDLAKNTEVGSAKIREYLSQIDYNLNQLK